MGTTYSITDKFGKNLALLLADKIKTVHPPFDIQGFAHAVEQAVANKTYTQRVAVIAEKLYQYLPAPYEESMQILAAILGEENPNETGMFTHYYWILPIGKYVEQYGLDHYEISMNAIEAITKRNTGEYAVRPFIRKYPEKSLATIHRWAGSENFHLRRLASEGLRPKLPWAPKLDTFIQHPMPVFEVLERLKTDPILFVKKSVANHLTDWLKVNKVPTALLIKAWQQSDDKHTQWIIKRATRKISIDIDQK